MNKSSVIFKTDREKFWLEFESYDSKTVLEDRYNNTESNWTNLKDVDTEDGYCRKASSFVYFYISELIDRVTVRTIVPCGDDEEINCEINVTFYNETYEASVLMKCAQYDIDQSATTFDLRDDQYLRCQITIDTDDIAKVLCDIKDKEKENDSKNE